MGLAVAQATAADAIAFAIGESLGSTSKRRGVRVLAAKLSDDTDPLLHASINAASLRYQETQRPEPLFVDPYAGCFVSSDSQTERKPQTHHFCIATKFIDDKLLETANNMNGLKQVVLLTDGMDTRLYRLQWPASTLLFELSPQTVFESAAKKLKGVGAKIPKDCLFFHVPLESANIRQTIQAKGFNGNRLSIWVMQGFPVMKLEKFEETLSIISSLATKGCLFLGELPFWLEETRVKSNTRQPMDKLFMSHDFRVNIISYEELAKSLGKKLALQHYESMLFISEQLRLSDDQMETWRKEFQRIEDEGDEVMKMGLKSYDIREKL